MDDPGNNTEISRENILNVENGPSVADNQVHNGHQNSDKEMSAAFFSSYCNVIDINTYDLIKNEKLLDDLDIIVFVGGFSFADVLGSAKGWYTVIQNNKRVREQFERFHLF